MYRVVHSTTLRILPVIVFFLPAVTAAQTVRGKIISDADGKPIQAANITVLAAQTDERITSRISRDGVFLFDVPKPGTYRLRVEALGYQTLTSAELTLPIETVVTVELRLRVNAIALEPLKVVAERKEPGFMREVRSRQRDGWGQLVTRDDLNEARGSILPEILMRGGLRVEMVRIPGSSRAVPMATTGRSTAHSRRMGCYAALYVNGTRQYPNALDSAEAFSRVGELMDTRPQEIEAIEIYKSRIETPGIYADTNAVCGVVAIWLRTGAEMFAEEEELMGELSKPRVTISLGGGSLGFSGSQAPERTIAVEAAAHWHTYKAFEIGFRFRYATPQIPAATAASMTQGVDSEIFVVPPGARRMNLWSVGLDPRLEFRSDSRLRPVLSAGLLVARRSFEIDNRLVRDKPLAFSSLGWGIGGAAGLAFDVGSWFQVEAAIAHDRLSFSTYRTLDSASLPTATQWSATSFRLNLSKPLWREGN